MTPAAILLSGGIGDYLHYISRFDSLVTELAVEDPVVFVESTAPDMVRSLFEAAFPGLDVRFVPPQIHWTKAHPLLDVTSHHDQQHRPAYRYVLGQGFEVVADWFLPFCCTGTAFSGDRIRSMLRPQADGWAAGAPDVAVSMRDKGFLWWPSEGLCRLIESHCRWLEMTVAFMGTPNEGRECLGQIVTARTVLDGLRLSAGAKLLIGTDTGFATIRQLLGLPSLYCINDYWWKDVMLRYGYASETWLAQSESRVALSEAEFRERLPAMLRACALARQDAPIKDAGRPLR